MTGSKKSKEWFRQKNIIKGIIVGLFITAVLIGSGAAYVKQPKYSLGTAFNLGEDVAIITGYTVDSYEVTDSAGKHYIKQKIVNSWKPIEETWLQKVKRSLHKAAFVGGIQVPDYYGDLNADGQINIVDALFIAQYQVGNRTFNQYQELAADVDKNGIIDINDALWIAKTTVLIPIPQDIKDNLETQITVIPSDTPLPGAKATPMPTPTMPLNIETKKLKVYANPSVLPLDSSTPLNIQVTTEDGNPIGVLLTLSGLETGTYQTDTTGSLRYYPNPTWTEEGDINIKATQLYQTQGIYYEGMGKAAVQPAPQPTATPAPIGISLTLDRDVVVMQAAGQEGITAIVTDNNGNPVFGASVNGVTTNYFGIAMVYVTALQSRTMDIVATKGSLTTTKTVTIKIIEPPSPPTPTPYVGYTPTGTGTGGGSTTKGTLYIWSYPSDANVLLDDVQVGTTNTQKYISLPLTAGKHFVEITKDDYTVYRQSVMLESGQSIKIDAYLQEIPRPVIPSILTETAQPRQTVSGTVQGTPASKTIIEYECPEGRVPNAGKTACIKPKTSLPGFEAVLAIGIIVTAYLVMRKRNDG